MEIQFPQKPPKNTGINQPKGWRIIADKLSASGKTH